MPQCRQICTFTADLRVGFRAPLRHSAHTDGPFPPVTSKNRSPTVTVRGPPVTAFREGEVMAESRKHQRSGRTFTAVIHRCPETRLYLAFVPGFPGAYTQAESLDELCANLRDVIILLLENGGTRVHSEFVGVQTLAIV
jgi:predicted RNase H-like HicB family nuclease